MNTFIVNLKIMVQGCSWVGNLNVYLLQWFFCRLAYQLKSNGKKYRFSLLFPVFPLTGWWNNYFPKKRFTIKLYRKAA